MGKTPLGLIIAGPPASGKGTQCANIKQQFGCVHLSTGDMLRAGMKKDKEAAEAMKKGGLVSDDVVIRMVKDRLEQDDVQENGFLLDGFPRTEAQAVALDKFDNLDVDCVVLLEVPDEKLVSRVLGRRMDPKTGKIYNINTDLNIPEEVKKRLEKRGDDTEESLKVRLGEFHKNIEPVVKVFGDKVKRIDGDRAPGIVWEEVEKVLEAVRGKKAKDALI